MRKGSLTIVGTGIKAVSHTTLEALSHIQTADKLFYLAADPITQEWLHQENPSAESLQSCYADGKPRMPAYRAMIQRLLAPLQDGKRVCGAFYGHPGVFVYPTHEAIRQARANGFDATMLPGVSADACLFADLGIDPARYGCSSFEATDFLVHQRRFDPRSSLVLWQIGLVGEVDFKASGYKGTGIALLVEALLRTYPGEHLVTVYEASQFVVCGPRIETLPLAALPSLPLTASSTLFVPLLEYARADDDVVGRLGLNVADLAVYQK
jgi:uncharacterized protein YabN with tetrapyrrole methylase and pyrophosphatase domain